MSKLTATMGCVLAAVLGGAVANAEGELPHPDLRVWQKYIAQYKNGELGVEDLINHVTQETTDELSGLLLLIDFESSSGDPKLLRGLLKHANPVCDLPREELAVKFKGGHGVAAEDVPIEHICAAAVALARLDKSAIADVLKTANERCRHVIRYCAEAREMSVNELLDIIANTHSFFIKEAALRPLRAARRRDGNSTENDARLVAVLKNLLAEVEKDDRGYGMIALYAKSMMKELGVGAVEQVDGGNKDRPETEKTIRTRPASNEQGKAVESKTENSVEPQRETPEKDKEKDPKTIWIVAAGAVLAAVVLVLLLGVKPWKD